MAPDGRATPGPPPAAPAARSGAARAAQRPARGPRWGWLEVFVLSQTFLPALLFVPGMSAVRTPLRIAAYAIAPAAWCFVAWRGRRHAGVDTFPARPWLFFCAGWLLLSIAHPNS